MRATVLLGSVTVLSLVVQIVRTKLMALEVGRAGMALVAQFSDYQTLVAGFLLVGTEQGLIAVAADAYSRGDPNALKSVLKLLRRRIFPFALAALVVLTALTPWILPKVTGQPDYLLPGALAIGALAAQLLIRPWQAFINGAQNFRLLARARLAESLFGLALLLPLALGWHLVGALYSLALLQIVSLLATLWAWRRLAPPAASELATVLEPIESASTTLLRFGVASLAGIAIGNGLSLALRRVIIAKLGLDQSGLYQVAYGLTQQYLTLVLGAMSAYSFPAFRAVHRDPIKLAQEVNQTLRGALLIIVPIIATLLVFRQQFIWLLFSKDYLPAGDMLRVQLIGDLFKVIAWALGMPILASGRAGLHIALELLLSCTWLLAIFFGCDFLGTQGPSWAFLAIYVFAGGIYLMITRRVFGFRFTAENLVLVGASTTCLVLVDLSGDFSLALSAAAAGVLVAIWALICVKRSEILGLRDYVLQRIGRFPQN